MLVSINVTCQVTGSAFIHYRVRGWRLRVFVRTCSVWETARPSDPSYIWNIASTPRDRPRIYQLVNNASGVWASIPPHPDRRSTPTTQCTQGRTQHTTQHTTDRSELCHVEHVHMFMQKCVLRWTVVSYICWNTTTAYSWRTHAGTTGYTLCE